jgi:hypothetical protein
MAFNQGHLIVSDAADLGVPPIQSISPAPIRSHLVAPQPVPREMQLDLREVTVRLVALESRVQELDTCVLMLSAPGWWRRQWIALNQWWRRVYGAS